MDSRSILRPLLTTLVVAAALALIGGGFVAVVNVRGGGGTSQSPAIVPPAPKPTVSPSGRPTPTPAARWLVGKATKNVVVHTAPNVASPVKATLGKTRPSGFPMLVLVHSVRQIKGVAWFNVWMAVAPNGSRGWVEQGSLSFYTVTTKIVVDLSKRKLTVYQAGSAVGTFSVAVGSAQYPTPTGTFFITEKLVPTTLGGPYGVLAMGLSAFQPKLSSWPEGGVVGIHGTDQPNLIGQAISHGCVRLRNADIQKVDDWVRVGSPVIIQK
jgi:lipoprotein-anchoring transpeptidase ErfK/SrfK